MIPLIAISNILVLASGLCWAAFKYPQFKFLESPISNLGYNPSSRNRFIFVINAFAKLQLVLAFTISGGLDQQTPIQTSIILGFISLVLANSFVAKRTLHRLFVYVCVFFIATSVIMLYYSIQNHTVFKVLITLFTIGLPLTSLSLKHLFKKKYWQLPSLVVVLIWNLSAAFLFR